MFFWIDEWRTKHRLKKTQLATEARELGFYLGGLTRPALSEGQSAPSATHFLRTESSSGVICSPTGGMALRWAGALVVLVSRRLWSGLPGTIQRPMAPVRRAAALLERSIFPG